MPYNMSPQSLSNGFPVCSYTADWCIRPHICLTEFLPVCKAFPSSASRTQASRTRKCRAAHFDCRWYPNKRQRLYTRAVRPSAKSRSLSHRGMRRSGIRRFYSALYRPSDFRFQSGQYRCSPQWRQDDRKHRLKKHGGYSFSPSS